MKTDRNPAEFRSTFIRRAALLVWLVITMSPSDARAQQTAESKKVLVLYWYNKDHSWNVNFDRNFQGALRSAPVGTFEYYPEYLESNRFPGENQSLLLRDYLRQKYADRTIDVVVANSDASLDFLMKYRDDLFPDTPIVVITTRRPTTGELAARPDLTGLTTLSDHRKTVDLALRLHPRTKQIFVVSGTLQHDKRLETVAREDLRDYESRVRISYLTDWSPDELAAKAKTLPEDSIVLYIWQQSLSDQSRVLETQDILALVARSASVPIYGMANVDIGIGAIGGYVNTAEATGSRAAEIVLQIANGVKARDIPVESAPIVPIFDWRELRRWGISEDELPADSLVRFKEPSLWDQHKQFVIGALGLITVQTGLIGWLLIEYRRRRLAEKANRHLAAIVESSDEAILGASLDGKILSWNSGAELMYGYTAAEMLGRPIPVIVPADRMEEFSSSLMRRRRGEKIKLETVRLRKDGTRIDVSLSVTAIKDGKGRIIATAAIARDVSERKRAELELQRLTTHLLNLQDAERRRLARELHDVTAQNMFTINMNLSRLQRRHLEPREAQALLAESSELCEQALQEIRTLSYVLHPPVLDEAGLVGALRWYIQGSIKRSGINIELFATHEIGRLPSHVETALFRIVQESLTNIRRHSGSSSAQITLEKEKDQVVLQIRDHGRGMRTIGLTEPDGSESTGVGIAGMRQRLRQLGGSLKIESSDRGLLVIAKAPIPNVFKNSSDIPQHDKRGSLAGVVTQTEPSADG
jgi:PAS domain S-box-containing protein